MQRDDAGAVVALVAIMMVVLLGMGALVIDVGQLYAERRELQNGADAAALAVAQDCAGGDCRDETATARTYANDNAHDGKAGVQDVCGSGPGLVPCASPPPHAPAANWVKVRTITPDDDKIDFVFAPVLGHDAGKADATAVAVWSNVGGATVIPVVFSVCEFAALGGKIDGSVFPNTKGYVYVHGDGPDHGCPTSPSGLKLPGGFGWTDHDGTCKVSVRVGDWLGSDNGNNFPGGCDATKWQNKDVLIPLYDQTRGGGSHGEYHVVGFASFKVLGYKLKQGGDWNMPGNGKCPGTSGNSGVCFYGEFTHFVLSSGQTGGGTNFGALVIEMIG
jgi:hypothetical protein